MRHLYNLVLSFSVLFFVSNGFSDQIETDNWKEINSRAEKAVALIQVRYSVIFEGKELYSSGGHGTGFLTSKYGFMVTNRHVAKPWEYDEIAQKHILESNNEAYIVKYYHIWFYCYKNLQTQRQNLLCHLL